MRVFDRFMPSFVCLVLFTATWPLSASGQSKVVLESRNGKYRLTRNGAPYFIKGVGGHTHLAALAAAGGNSIRTWGADRLETILDQAHSHKLTVCVGLWLGHERHGFDYADEAAVRKQLNNSLDAIRRFKDHPAVLIWGIGNEMEGTGTNQAVWDAVEEIARESKRIDPNHPTMTVINEVSDDKLQNIEQFCPHIDIVGVNSYGGVSSLAERYRATGVKKPYVVTEHGPYGPWEVGKTDWGAPIEPSSTEKGKIYADGYRKAVTEQRGLCLGSYAFLWGHKQETTATWFGMLLPDGSRLAAADAMTELWTGSPPQNRCPRIEALDLDRPHKFKSGEMVTARLVTSDPDNDPLTIKWVLRSDSVTLGQGGDPQTEESAFADAVSSKGNEAALTLPEDGGGYRLFAYVDDGEGGAAVTNVPLYVDAPNTARRPKAQLPFTLYADEMKESPYAPSGYMGNTTAIRMTDDSTESPHSGDTCLKVEYQAADNWGGVLWQSPPNDWEGTKPGGLDLTGASELEFWVRGAKGGEIVNFVFGVVDGDVPYRDSAKGELKGVRLTTQWQELRIPLAGRDLSRIKTGFGWSLEGQGKPVTFYLDDIRYVAREVGRTSASE